MRYRSMQIPVLIQTSYFMANKSVLVDSRATNNFMHPNFAKRMGLRSAALERPQKIWNADNTENKEGMITHHLDLDVEAKGIHKDMRFYITNIGKEISSSDILGLLCTNCISNGGMPR